MTPQVLTTSQNLPDVQDIPTHSPGIQHAIAQVGVSAFSIPLKIQGTATESLLLEASVSCSAQVPPHQRALHMSRFIRLFYEFSQDTFTLEHLEVILRTYQKAFESIHCALQVQFRYPLIQTSLLSGLQGYHFYPITWEGIIDEKNQFHKITGFEFTYASACPCSSALAQHSIENKQHYSIAHSQRSLASVRVVVAPNASLDIASLHTHCLQALHTETQIMVRREDEQRFAELNGTHVKFVEDASRQLYAVLDADPRIISFSLCCRHYESLHPYDAVASMRKGHLPPKLFDL